MSGRAKWIEIFMFGVGREHKNCKKCVQRVSMFALGFAIKKTDHLPRTKVTKLYRR
jgi:hypothetical protein